MLKEKRETISEFVAKKREICLSNMNIFNKREETERLEDFIKNEKESLKARKYVTNKKTTKQIRNPKYTEQLFYFGSSLREKILCSYFN